MSASNQTHRTFATDHMEPGSDTPAPGSNAADLSQSFATLVVAEQQGARHAVQMERDRAVRTDWRVRTGLDGMARYGRLMTQISSHAGSGLGKGR